jgi:outer membrane protein TolC
MIASVLVSLALAQSSPELRVAPPRSTVDPAAADVAAAGPLLTLDDALREAQAGSLDLRQAQARLDQARTGTRRARAGYLPQVRASATYTHNNTGVEFPAGTFGEDSPAVVIQEQDQVVGQLEATQAILAPRTWFGVRSARIGTALAEETLEGARREVLFATAQTYYGAVANKKSIAVQERQLSIALAHEKDARVRFEAGAVPKITLLRAEIDRSRADQDLTRTRNAYQSSKVALATLVGRPDAAFEVDVPGSPALPPDPGALEKAAVEERPEVRAAQRAAELERSNRRALLARYAPALGAFGRYQVSNAGGFTGDAASWAIGLQATWDLFDGGLREADLRENAARIAEVDAALGAVRLRAVEEVRRARLDLESAVANRVKAEEQAQLARENQRLVEVNFKAGAATYLEVSDANLALAAAELGAVNESLAADLAALELLRAAGRFAAR